MAALPASGCWCTTSGDDDHLDPALTGGEKPRAIRRLGTEEHRIHRICLAVPVN
jgi:hypothetical protein